MWSGPRNISTAMMRAWENRPDTIVCDEPFYAHWLTRSDIEHPGRAEIIARCETDWRTVAEDLVGPVPGGHSIHYQKHMAHHLLGDMVGDWLDALSHALLIRHPRAMLISLSKVVRRPSLEETGLPQQWQLYERFAEAGCPPPVIDSRDVLEHPDEMLAALCAALDVPFVPEMLAWPAGPRDTDGIWAKHWYASVEASTGFGPYRPPADPLPASLESLYETCMEYYRRLSDVKIQPNP